MNNRKLKIAMLAALGFLGAGAIEAQAADITVIDQTSVLIHPYFRSNCWDPASIPAKGNEWVFFGGILPGTQFTWTTFEVLLKAKCKKPVVRFTFALDGEAPPTGRAMKERTTRLEFDATVPVYTITLGNVPEIVGVTPADSDGDDDGD